MSGSRILKTAEIAARGGGPPLPLPETLDDMGPIMARWPLMLKYDPPSGDLWLRYIVETHPWHTLVPAQYIATYRTVVGNHMRKMLRMDGFTVEAAKVVWLLHHGKWPERRLVRRDGSYLNDRIDNLELAPEGAGSRGRVRIRPVGVTKFYDRWRAYVDRPGHSRKILGTFTTEQEAVEARKRWDEAQDLV